MPKEKPYYFPAVGHIYATKVRKPRRKLTPEERAEAQARRESKAWAKAGAQYAGNIYHLPSLNATHAPGPGPVARGIPSASTHLPVSNKPHPPARPPGPGPSAPAGSKIRKRTKFATHSQVRTYSPKGRLNTDLDALMATPPRKKRTKKQ